MTLSSVCIIVKDAVGTLPDLVFGDLEGRFDEIVIVDTGSSDGTREAILKNIDPGLEWPAAGECLKVKTMPLDSEALSARAPAQKYVLSTFEWVQDFAAARNYAFGLANGRWRGYLDADDRFPEAFRFVELLKKIDAESDPSDPYSKNCVSLPYVYKENDTVQDSVLRFVRWEDGWQWKDEVHERLERVVEPGAGGPRGFGGRRHHVETGLPVLHMRTDYDEPFKRNMDIAFSAYSHTDPKADPLKRGRMAYHVAQGLMAAGDQEAAIGYLLETADAYRGLVYERLALSDLARMMIDKANFEPALRFAGRLVANQPENAFSWITLGFCHARSAGASVKGAGLLWGSGRGPIGEWHRALTLFEHAARLPEPPLNAFTELWFEQGLAPTWHARTLFELGHLDKAVELLERVEPEMRAHPCVRPDYLELHGELLKALGVQRLQQMVEFYIWDTEPKKALDLVENAPSAIANDPRIKAIRTNLHKKLPHLKSFDDYLRCYGDLEEETYHTPAELEEAVLDHHRAQVAIHWAKQTQEGEGYLEVLAIGSQDGFIEEEMMKVNPRIRLTFVDVAPQASKGFMRLRERFGERVLGHQMDAHYDWFPAEMAANYDAVVMFEVLEHVPSEDGAAATLRSALKGGGTLMLSVPSSRRWIEPYLTGPRGPEWYGHLRAFNQYELAGLLRGYGFDGTIYEGFDGTLVAAMTLKPAVERKREPYHYGIYIPSTPKPFGPFSHLEGFCGGSEECVIHLAKHMAEQAHVTVYTPDHVRSDGSRVLYHEGVHWTTTDQFYSQDEDLDAVFFWRCPQLLPGLKEAPYKKILWLHDAYYGAHRSAYEAADEIVALSPTHVDSLVRGDDAPREKITVLGNGVDLESFRDLGGPGRKDTKRVIYASSPDRGLLGLLDMWPDVRAREPEAELHIYYDWSVFRRRCPREAEDLEDLVNDLPGVFYHGGVSHEELHSAFLASGVWAYPLTDPEVETFCITAVKAMAAGCIPVVVNTGALPHVLGGEHWGACSLEALRTPEGEHAFVEKLLQALHTPADKRADIENALWAQAEHWAWPEVARAFVALAKGEKE